MARGVLGMTPKLGKRETEVMKYDQNIMLLFVKHYLAHLPTTPELLLLSLQGGNTAQMSRQSRTRHGKLTQDDKFPTMPQAAAPGSSPITHMALVCVLSTSLPSKE